MLFNTYVNGFYHVNTRLNELGNKLYSELRNFRDKKVLTVEEATECANIGQDIEIQKSYLEEARRQLTIMLPTAVPVIVPDNPNKVVVKKKIMGNYVVCIQDRSEYE